MTLDEAMRKIFELSLEYRSGYKGFSQTHWRWKDDERIEAKADALNEALIILAEVNE